MSRARTIYRACIDAALAACALTTVAVGALMTWRGTRPWGLGDVTVGYILDPAGMAVIVAGGTLAELVVRRWCRRASGERREVATDAR